MARASKRRIPWFNAIQFHQPLRPAMRCRLCYAWTRKAANIPNTPGLDSHLLSKIPVGWQKSPAGFPQRPDSGQKSPAVLSQCTGGGQKCPGDLPLSLSGGQKSPDGHPQNPGSGEKSPASYLLEWEGVLRKYPSPPQKYFWVDFHCWEGCYITAGGKHINPFHKF